MSDSTRTGDLDHLDGAALLAKLIAISQNEVDAAVSSATDAEVGLNEQQLTQLVRDRATEAPVVDAITLILSKPVTSAASFRTAWTAVSILTELPLDVLPLYRKALVNLSEMDIESQPPGIGLSMLRSQGSDILRFLDNPDQAWTPQHKGDWMAERSLTERVDSAEAMRPHLNGLLSWLCDVNWPPFSGCRKQLARFPEVAVPAIRELLATETDDLEWLTRMIEFVHDEVPVGELWDTMRAEVEAKVDRDATDEDVKELSEVAETWLRVLDKSKGKQA
ncbi:hypothetical protein NQ176_g701 [Zarea fungicola]|uniref:Uncharacterized protein n=1 Tax=Zarea fungicola TaxID=93591 RepID=A0ACC1NWH5_9HYPO|nr:hypothetical protein NQ176_g701 [Lecanicillium fungicola]